jgi:hypothetical protein
MEGDFATRRDALAPRQRADHGDVFTLALAAVVALLEWLAPR